MIVPRTCTEILSENADRRPVSGPLEAFRSVPAYVLLGDPGAGKSTSFKVEAQALGPRAALIPARDFLTLNLDNRPEWRDRTLFIDGLDEIRVGSGDQREALDQVRSKLDALGCPPFRISCREADWLGDNDRNKLDMVSPEHGVTLLRLNALTDTDIADILGRHPAVDNAQRFTDEARRWDVEELLNNPLTLELLVRAVGSYGAWPQSKLETFEIACRHMAAEQNQEHIYGDRPPPVGRLLDAAGQLCAHLLISGAFGFSIRYEDVDIDYIAPQTQAGLDHEVARRTLETRLFKGVDSERFTPVHRHTAEFLGARHLARLIDDGLPVARVLALISGGDGIVVTVLRGLSAWLAAQCPAARGHLIDSDPVGVGLYGDLQEFSADDKRRMLWSLNREVANYDMNISAFASLASPEMEEILNDYLANQRRDTDHQMVTAFLLRVLRYGKPLPGLSDALLATIYDDSRWPWVVQCALVAFVHTSAQDPSGADRLRRILTDIGRGTVPDPDNELLGVLLANLYPQDITPSQIWDYLGTATVSNLGGTHQQFWRRIILERSTDEDVAQLLDYLHENLPDLRRRIDLHRLDMLPVELLVRALQTASHRQDPQRLYNWLDAVTSASRSARWVTNHHTDKVRIWLERHPDEQAAVFLEGLFRCPDGDEFELCAVGVLDRLYHSASSPDFALRCLDQSVATASANPRVSTFLLRYAAALSARPSNGQALSRAVMMDRVSGYAPIERQLAELLESQDRAASADEFPEIDLWRTETVRKEDQWIDQIRAEVEDLRENRASLPLLFQLGAIYFNVHAFLPVPSLVDRTLKDILVDDNLHVVAIAGLRNTVDRSDVPEVAEIIRARAESRMHPLGFPYLAAMDEIDRMDSARLEELSQLQMQRALAFYYCLPTGRDYHSSWYLRWLNLRPDLVADMLVQCAMPAIRSGKDYVPELANLAYRDDYAHVAPHASMRLLRSFPLRYSLQHLEKLTFLLWAALRCADRAVLQELIKQKLSRSSMNVTQRIHWLAAGVVVAPDSHLKSLTTFVGNRDDRVRTLARFFCPREPLPFLTSAMDASTLQALITLLARTVGPPNPEAGLVTPQVDAAMRISQMIGQLSSLLAIDATHALLDLSTDDTLSKWRFSLERARDQQQVIHRDANYRYPNVREVRQTLSNKAPANAADLAALVGDRLYSLTKRIRTGNTDDWRQYWNEGTHGRPKSPKIEDHCRDALLSDLRGLLPAGVDAQPEGQYANDKRADIRVSYAQFNVPVEIKKDSHRDLWSALQNQLISQYTNDPDTSGHGIYLVFWFGDGDIPAPSQGRRPTYPVELQERLEEQLTEPERRRIAIRVVDVSPGG